MNKTDSWNPNLREEINGRIKKIIPLYKYYINKHPDYQFAAPAMDREVMAHFDGQLNELLDLANLNIKNWTRDEKVDQFMMLQFMATCTP